ncbi:hypothetical protein EDE04_4007 [Streptomyces sp. 2132.2]|uniref:hypothetical protein n=1 Tax=Streptomyces sp. 2132.2 TaxID=2485161 RepID=UPI000F462B45|nr:hypothetical protein [Streptomyces sp. 2132.2]ROQ97508.1 hypothetical protein EDE04_4007 [Streptomyces sp. 2132.2]
MRATFRTAAITAGAITALALPTAQAFAADASSAEDVKREALRTVNLEKGWSGKVYELARYEGGKKAATLGHETDVIKDGRVRGTLKGHDGKGNARTVVQRVDGLSFTLDRHGRLTAQGVREGAGQQGHTFVTRYENLGGSGFDADILNGEAVRHTLKTDGRKADTAQHNGAHFVLNPDGTMKGWTEGAAKPAVAHPERGADAGAVVPKGAPKGGVRAGAEQVKPSADGAVLMAGGAGLAAAGAAGPGFSMLRRRRGEG